MWLPRVGLVSLNLQAVYWPHELTDSFWGAAFIDFQKWCPMTRLLR